MMVNIRKFFYFFISIYLFLSPLAYSEESFQQQTFSFLQLSGMDGWVFKGVNATNTIYLPIMPQWDVENIQLHFIFERAIDSGNPTHLNMYIDDVPFASLELTSEKKIWDVTIPKDRIKKELINLKISNNL